MEHRKPIWTVALVGAESSGKTTMATLLAAAYHTVFVPEFGRAYGAEKDTRKLAWTSDEFVYIAKAQCVLEDAAIWFASDILFCDTDVLTTALFHEEYMGRKSEDVLTMVRGYDLTFFCRADFPFVEDGARDYMRRHRHEKRLLEELEASQREFVWLGGSVVDRVTKAMRVIADRFALEAVR